jgi:hypothetical protein
MKPASILTHSICINLFEIFPMIDAWKCVKYDYNKINSILYNFFICMSGQNLYFRVRL